MAKIVVKTPSAKYEVLVGAGLLASLSRRVSQIARGSGGKGARKQQILVLTSTEIWALWSERFLESFRVGSARARESSHAQTKPANELPCVLFLPPGERSKQLSEVARLGEEMAAAGADRSSLLIAFGGGIVGDVAGFLAAIYMRGIDYIQIPTTLLAQVDSSVGGKTGVNLAAGKNLIGSFHHPLAVFADIDLLQTLPDRELKAGLFESIKAGVIRDPALFRFMEQNVEAILGRDPKALERVIAASVRMKAEVVGIDERESGLRMILNFGHTLGHAIESATDYEPLLHGEAVAWGMLAATHLGVMRGTITEADADRIVDLIFAFGPLPTFSLGSKGSTAAARLVAAAGRDKKNRAGVRRFVLPSGIGNAVVVEDVTDEELVATAEWLVRAAGNGADHKSGDALSSEPDPTPTESASLRPVPPVRQASRVRQASGGRQ